MSSLESTSLNTPPGARRKTPRVAPAAKASRGDTHRNLWKQRIIVARKQLITRSHMALALRHAVRLLVWCGALYALYTFGLYILFRDRLFYSLFIARGLML